MATSELTTRPAHGRAAVLDDADSRPGSATSLLRTIVAATCDAWVAGLPPKP